eukprot:15352232-Ditylum_brightwellii.AAC.2
MGGILGGGNPFQSGGIILGPLLLGPVGGYTFTLGDAPEELSVIPLDFGSGVIIVGTLGDCIVCTFGAA